ncbi:MAG: hypothetical protein MUD12_16715, partial [Spirochaetes bacterium]|nr:hypothetical protein [Spirochaetota bacterium]
RIAAAVSGLLCRGPGNSIEQTTGLVYNLAGLIYSAGAALDGDRMAALFFFAVKGGSIRNRPLPAGAVPGWDILLEIVVKRAEIDVPAGNGPDFSYFRKYAEMISSVNGILEEKNVEYDNLKLMGSFKSGFLVPALTTYGEMLSGAPAGVMEDFMYTALEYMERNFDPVLFYEDILRPRLESWNASGLPAGIADEAGSVRRRAMPYLSAGVVPPPDGVIAEPDSMSSRVRSFAEGLRPDLSDENDRRLFYSYISRSVSMTYAYFEKTMDSAPAVGITSPRLFTEKISVTAGAVVKTDVEGDDGADFESERNEAVDLATDPSVICGLVLSARQVSGKKKASFLSGFNLDAECLEGLVRRLLEMQLVNFQPEISSLIGKALAAHALLSEPALLNRLLRVDGESAREALRQLYGDRVFESLNKMLSEEFYAGFFTMVESMLGVTLSGGFKSFFAGAPLDLKTGRISGELGTAVMFLSVRSSLNRIVSGGMKNGGPEIFRMDFSLSGERPLELFSGLYRVPGRVYLKVEKDETGVSYRVRTGNAWVCLGFEGGRFFLPGGKFPGDDGSLTSLSMAVQTLNGLVAIDPSFEAGVRKSVAAVNRFILPLLTPCPGKKHCVRNRTGSYLRGPSEKAHEVLFAPAWDAGLLFRGAVAGDCSNLFASQVFDPSFHFFRIIHDGRWCGYLSLVDVECGKKRRALLLDVFNVNSRLGVDWLDVFTGFIGRISAIAAENRYEYILVPDRKALISNYDFIREPVYKKYRDCRRVDGKKLRPVSRGGIDYQASGCDCLVVWEEGMPADLHADVIDLLVKGVRMFLSQDNEKREGGLT